MSISRLFVRAAVVAVTIALFVSGTALAAKVTFRHEASGAGSG